jgi:hypothetical protein
MHNKNYGLKQILKQSLGMGVSIVGSAIALSLLPQAAQAATTCAFNPAGGKPNPLGMRAFVTVIENEGDTTFLYEQFPANIGIAASGQVAATIANRRELTMYSTPIEKARKLMLETPAFFNELMGSKDSEGFAPINAVLACKPGLSTAARPPAPKPTSSAPAMQAKPSEAAVTSAAAMTPAASAAPAATPAVAPAVAPAATLGSEASKKPAIAMLADGTYRYWNGTPTTPQTAMTDDELLKAGGALFLFEKKGSQVRGFFGSIDSDPGACIRGQINGNTVAGFAYPQPQSPPSKEPLKDPGETFVTLGTSNFLRVRNLATDGRGRKFYSSALLNLSGFNSVSLGSGSLAKICRF